MSDAPAAEDRRYESVGDWLAFELDERMLPQELLEKLCTRLIEAGVPVHRSAVFVRTLHPDVMGRRFMWVEGEGVTISEASYAVLDTPWFLKSPANVIAQTGETVRRRICDPDCPDDFDFLDELRADAVTDYVGHPLTFVNGERHAVTWTTKAPGGFEDWHVKALERVRLPLSRFAELYAMRRTATNLLNTYVGPGAGEHIMSGQIRRGNLTTIEAAIWFADLRGFTSLADRLDGNVLLRVLNDYFDSLVPAIQTAGGEVLKYIGDGLLAIFPVAKGADRRAAEADACAAAILAARDGIAKLATLNQEREKSGAPTLSFGLALHIGEVLYGNVGAAGRLDFTTIGPAVNLASRLQALGGETGREVVVSAEFAAFCGGAAKPLGAFALKGISHEQEAFGLDVEAAVQATGAEKLKTGLAAQEAWRG